MTSCKTEHLTSLDGHPKKTSISHLLQPFPYTQPAPQSSKRLLRVSLRKTPPEKPRTTSSVSTHPRNGHSFSKPSYHTHPVTNQPQTQPQKKHPSTKPSTSSREEITSYSTIRAPSQRSTEPCSQPFRHSSSSSSSTRENHFDPALGYLIAEHTYKITYLTPPN